VGSVVVLGNQEGGGRKNELRKDPRCGKREKSHMHSEDMCYGKQPLSRRKNEPKKIINAQGEEKGSQQKRE